MKSNNESNMKNGNVQMKERLFYTASCSLIEEVELLTINKPSQSKDIDDEPNAINLSAKYLLDNLKRSTIEEIWKLSRVTSETTNEVFINEMHFNGKVWGIAHAAVIKDKLIEQQETSTHTSSNLEGTMLVNS
ncbi:hypothetical protein C2G38_2225080 [Gigaspora rosea]|uniref:Uncharacterized protein n=1 Tax=Gigaspora rosea TaxID=44941 RepID=A0A397U3S5_9GLOM|nr:hypothetical protein C2G38_2225080 [Gigaspora rosea]